MSKNEKDIARFQCISALRGEHTPEDAIKFLVKNTNHEYKMILATDLLDLYPSSSNILLFYESLINNNFDMDYTKSENLNWIEKNTKHFDALTKEDAAKITILLNERMYKKPLIAREIFLILLKRFCEKDDLGKIDIFVKKLRNNYYDNRHRYLIAKEYKEHGALIAAYEMVEKIEDSNKKNNLKNDILMHIARYVSNEIQLEINEIIRGSNYEESQLGDFINKIMIEHSEIYSFEYNKIRDEGVRGKISPREIIKSIARANDIDAADLFIYQVVNPKEIKKIISHSKTISIPGIVSRLSKNR